MAKNEHESKLNAMRSKLDCVDKRLLRRCRDELWPDPPTSYVNRAANKLHQLNQIFNSRIVNQQKTRWFVDLCGGPGGFSEYTLHNSHKEAKGFGITLKEKEIQLKIQPSPRLSMSYGVDGTGNLCNPHNIRHFVNMVARETKCVDLVLADGAFDTTGQENQQESLHARLILAEILVACLLRPHVFVCKFFDCFTPVTRSFLYFLCDHFASVQIEKPQLSRPANSERYVVCRESSRTLTQTEENFLFQQLCSSQQLQPLPFSSLSTSLDMSNHEIVEMQIRALQQLITRIERTKRPS